MISLNWKAWLNQHQLQSFLILRHLDPKSPSLEKLSRDQPWWNENLNLCFIFWPPPFRPPAWRPPRLSSWQPEDSIHNATSNTRQHLVTIHQVFFLFLTRVSVKEREKMILVIYEALLLRCGTRPRENWYIEEKLLFFLSFFFFFLNLSP